MFKRKRDYKEGGEVEGKRERERVRERETERETFLPSPLNLQLLAFRLVGLAVVLKSKQLSYMLEKKREGEGGKEREREKE
jgi:hypothetical protein